MSASLPHVEQRQLFTAVRDGSHRFESVEDVLQTFVKPLQPLLGAELSSTLLESPLASSSSTAIHSAAAFVTVVEAAQEAFLRKIAIDWQDALSQHGVFDKLLTALFFASPASTRSLPSSRGVIQQCGLRVVSRILITGRHYSVADRVSGSALHSLVCNAVLRVCSLAVDMLSLDCLVHSALTEPNLARRSVSWSDTLRLLISFPDRVANFMQGKMPESLVREAWYARVLVQGTTFALQPQTDASHQPERAKILADVVSSLDKNGYLTSSSVTTNIDARPAFWPTLLCNILSGSPIQTVEEQWASLAAHLDESPRLRVSRSLTGFLDEAARRLISANIVTPAEKNKPGSEGSQFLSTANHEFVAAAWVVMDTFLLRTSGDGEEEELSALLELTLSSLPQTPVMAWTWVCVLMSKRPTRRVSILNSTLQHWADHARIRHATLDQEQYVTTLIVCLLASITAPADEEDGRTLTDIARSSSLLEGVSHHLEHPDPVIRRFGMLVAELMSARTVVEAAKKLQFGRGIWDGTGQGREEARVLRALHDAWSYHEKAVVKLHVDTDRDAIFRIFGLGVDQIADTQSVIIAGHSRNKASSEPPKSRRLPARMAPPPRVSAARSLITVMGSDEDDNIDEEPNAGSTSEVPLLRMFAPASTAQHGASRKAPLEGEEASSSDDAGNSSDSSDDAGEQGGSNNMDKLAADLAGLDPSHASTLLGAASTASRNKNPKKKTRAAATDFDADKEAHAPTFEDKRARPPVYISQLAPLLKSNERASVKVGLKYAAVLIRRKSTIASGGRGEIDENAVDLGLSLVALHNNFSIGKFDDRRMEALVALLVGSPKVTAAVLTEQVFGSQYSLAQRLSMLTAITQGALELATGEQPTTTHHAHLIEGKAREIGDVATTRAKHQGEDKVPAIRRERSLMVNGQATRYLSKGPLIQQLPTHHAMSASFAPVNALPRQTWVETVGQCMIFPLVNRFLAYYADFCSTRRGRGVGRTTVGAGMSALFGSTTVSALLDTLTVLVDLAAPTPSFAYEVTSLTLELVSALLLDADYAVAGTDSDSVPVLASALNLLLVTLRHNLYPNGGSRASAQIIAAFVQRNGETLRPLLLTTRRTFEQSQQALSLSGAADASQDRFRTRIASRSAALLLLASELEESHREHVTSLLGFHM